MADATGYLTTDKIPVQLLYTEIAQNIELVNQELNAFRATFARDTEKKSVRVPQRSMKFVKGTETQNPEVSQIITRDYDLPEPVMYEVAEGITKEAIERGMSAEEIRDQHAEALKAYERLQQQAILTVMLTSGGFWDGLMTLAPPKFKMNTFATSHTHYLAANVAGVPALSHFTAMKKTIIEHGYGLPNQGGQLVGFMNSTQGSLVENKAEWATTANYVGTGLIEDLQKHGLWPSGIAGRVLQAAGVPVVVEDWVPENYLLMADYRLGDKLGRWRLTEGVDGRGLIAHLKDDFKEMVNSYRTYVSFKVVHQSAGAAMYLGSATWANPSGYEL